MKAMLILCLVLVGCSKWGDPVPGKQMSGDLAAFVLQCAAARGAHPTTNNLPSLQVQWTYQEQGVLEDIIFVPGDHFGEIESFLKQAFGELDRERGSIPVSAVGTSGTRQGVYSGRQIGVGLNFAGDAKQTVICIIGAARP